MNWDTEQKFMINVLRDNCSNEEGVTSSRRLGAWLKKFKDMVFSRVDIGYGETADLRLMGISEKRPMTEWYVEKVGKGK